MPEDINYNRSGNEQTSTTLPVCPPTPIIAPSPLPSLQPAVLASARTISSPPPQSEPCLTTLLSTIDTLLFPYPSFLHLHNPGPFARTQPIFVYKHFDLPFWRNVVGANTNAHLTAARARLLEIVTKGKVTEKMIMEVVERWGEIWGVAVEVETWTVVVEGETKEADTVPELVSDVEPEPEVEEGQEEGEQESYKEDWRLRVAEVLEEKGEERILAAVEGVEVLRVEPEGGEEVKDT